MKDNQLKVTRKNNHEGCFRKPSLWSSTASFSLSWRHGFDKWNVGWGTGWISRWRSETSDVPQGFPVGWVLFNIFINDIYNGIEFTQRIFGHQAEVVQLTQLRDGMQSEGHGQTCEVDLWELHEVYQSQVQCVSPKLEQGSTTIQASRWMDWEQVLESLVNERLDLTLQCVLAAQKAIHILDCIKSNVASRVSRFCFSVFMRPHPECYIQLQSSQHRTAGPEATKMIRDGITLLWGHTEIGEVFSLKKRVQGDINAVFPFSGSL